MEDSEKQTILIVDDDPLIRRIVNKALVAAGYLVVEANSGAAALELAQKAPPSLILLDLMLPGMDGYEVCDRLRLNPHTTNIPIIMLTALDQTEAKVRGFRSGADDYLTKPFDIDELQTRVQAHLRRSERDIGTNPLTVLPGNAQIERVIWKRINDRAPMAVLYVDLTNFKEFNDEYGWVRGDEVIRMLAKHLLNVADLFGNKDDFVGHVGGDDFILISTPACAESIAKELIARFDADIPLFYPEDTRARGYLEVADRRGTKFRAPLVSVAVAIITNESFGLRHPGQVAARAAEVKKLAKSEPGSRYVFDRRRK
jgi:PleD family two-component response regulator